MAQGSARYERSAAGMVGAMIVTLLVILAFVAFRALNREQLSVQPNQVDYLQVVKDLQGAGGVDPAYPERLPKGWIATRAVYNASNYAWELDVLTADGKYIGLRQAAVRDRDLLEDYGYDEVKQGPTVDIGAMVSPEWKSWSFKGHSGDTVYTTALGLQWGDEPNPARELGKGQTVLVFGSAPATVIRDFAASLVQDPRAS
ncbi:DUF4245 family protein [Nocardioides jiangxiensis]|uniref:DUF4245 family protein n=1 Tax=Nocardioides jiangxiensis TaxID=3064524 RepID=A0ABT9B207_9ACTN|nr:DUF4245 family protein [Nocardioides sp. WY-20]MDO7868886.1 DUF4245 family protein [Nocardioides sp. WY-20]